MDLKTMNEPLKITYRHGDREISVQIDNCIGHISEAFDAFFDVLKGAGFHEESIDKYLTEHESNT